MPELAEVEAYRRLAEAHALGRVIAELVAPDAWYLKRGVDFAELAAALEGRSLTAARRTGKLLLLDTGPVDLGAGGAGGTGVGEPGQPEPVDLGPVGVDLGEAGQPGPVLGLRFGMSGRLVVDGVAGVDRLLYSSARELEAWDRFALRFADGGDLRMRDPRRLGGVELDPAESRLGPDALTVKPSALAAALAGSTAPLKARLLDQSRLAGVGNLAADEALWRAGLDPARPAMSLSPAELRRLHRHLRATMADLIARGGSHTGDLMPHRQSGGLCPKDGTPLVRRTVGGRTTWSCPHHQR